jgi:hypothetical protein
MSVCIARNSWIFIAVLMVASACDPNPSAQSEPKRVEMPLRPTDPRLEKKLERWQPGAKDSRAPPDEFLNANPSLPGIWTKGAGRASVYLQFTANPKSQFNVKCTIVGDALPSGWTTDRTATYKNSVITFNRPVSLKTTICQKLYSVRVGGKDLLVSPADIGNLLYRVRENRISGFFVCAFERVSPAAIP